MDDVVDFLRNNDFNERDVNKPTLDVITDLSGVDIPWSTDLSRQKFLEKAVEWLRNNDANPDEVGKATLKPLTNLSGITMPKKMTLDDKEKTLDDVVYFLRNNRCCY